MRCALSLKLRRFMRPSAADEALLERMCRTNVRSLSAREDLIREGDKPRGVVLVLAGWACRYKTLEDGRRQIVGLCLPGDVCDLNLFLLARTDHSVGALTALDCAELPRDLFDAIAADHPRVMRALWRDALHTAAIQREWILNLGQRSAIERLSHLFCELFVRLNAVGLTEGAACGMPLTQADLADTVGMTPVHVNRTLRELRARKLVRWCGRRLAIPDFGGLSRLGLFNPNYLRLERDNVRPDAEG